jgi:hypothetical protein
VSAAGRDAALRHRRRLLGSRRAPRPPRARGSGRGLRTRLRRGRQLALRERQRGSRPPTRRCAATSRAGACSTARFPMPASYGDYPDHRAMAVLLLGISRCVPTAAAHPVLDHGRAL